MGASAVLVAHQRIAVQDVPAAPPGPAEVRLAVAACGVCGSDVTSYATGRYVQPGQVMGHEIVGRVVELGEDVAGGLRVGDRVMVQPVRSCGGCWYCRRGDVHLCGRTAELSIAYGLPGGYAQELTIPGADVPGVLVRVADDVADEDAIWAEPVAVALHALGRAGVAAGAEVGIIGAGSIGLALVAAATATGAVATVVEPRPQRRAMALATGAVEAHPAPVGNARFDVVLDSSGVPPGIASGFRMLRPSGTLVLVGVTDAEVPAAPDVHVRGAFGYRPGEFERSTALINRGVVRLGRAVTHRFGLDRIVEAFDAVRHDPTAGKVAIVP